jgi:hypothetical protein
MALEARVPADQPKLIAGLKKLSQADPAVATMIQETGETVICTAGELHAERCIRDLEERFAKIKIQRGNILVPFRETVVPNPHGRPFAIRAPDLTSRQWKERRLSNTKPSSSQSRRALYLCPSERCHCRESLPTSCCFMQAPSAPLRNLRLSTSTLSLRWAPEQRLKCQKKI